MKGKVLFIVIFGLVTNFSVGFPHRSHHHRITSRSLDNVCRSQGLKLAICLLQIDTEDIKHNIRCRMDPETCSESMLRISGDALTTFKLNNVCNENFLHNLRVSLEQFYSNFSRIRAHITRLQSDLILTAADPLQTLTNKLSNDIRNAIQACQPNVALPFPVTETSDRTGVGSSESDMLMDLIQTINNFDHFINVAYNTLNTRQ